MVPAALLCFLVTNRLKVCPMLSLSPVLSRHQPPQGMPEPTLSPTHPVPRPRLHYRLLTLCPIAY
jgi:hypothetical protein